MTFAEVIHYLVDNSQAFSPADKIEAHKSVSAQFGETDRHYSVPSPEEENAATDEKAQKIADLKAQLAALEPEPASEPASEPAADFDPAKA